MRVSVLDYGAGNLHSLCKALAAPGVEVVIEPDPVRAATADALVLPGVGAFGGAAAHLAPARDALRRAIAGGLPVLGICLGMQLLFEASAEGAGAGLGVLTGRVVPLRARRVPQMGWNTLDDERDPLLATARLREAYFANGYVCQPAHRACVRAWSTHEALRFPALVRQGRVVGVQFHPEKSSAQGVAFVHAFLEEARP